MFEKEYELRNGGVYDKKHLKYLTNEEIVDLLNKFAESEWNKFVNGGW